MASEDQHSDEAGSSGPMNFASAEHDSDRKRGDRGERKMKATPNSAAGSASALAFAAAIALARPISARA